jgi:hypothetical protein
MDLLTNLARSVESDEDSASAHKRMQGAIDYLYEVSSDRGQLDEEALKRKALAWLKLLGTAVLDKYFGYTVRALCLSRGWRGPITADEFLRVSVRVRNGEVWSVESHEWISFDQAASRLMNWHRRDLARLYVLADEGKGSKEEVIEQCRQVIYGWED